MVNRISKSSVGHSSKGDTTPEEWLSPNALAHPKKNPYLPPYSKSPKKNYTK